MRSLLALLALTLVPAAPVAAEPLPQVAMHLDDAVAEGATLRVVVALDRPVSYDVHVRVDTRSREARGLLDYTPVHGVVEIRAGRTHAAVTVDALADGLDEASETFVVRLSDPENAALVDGADRATVAIADRDRPPRVLPQDAEILEPSITNQLGFTEVRLSTPSGRRVVVQLATRPGTATTSDFVPLHPIAVFAPGETSQLVSVEVLPDALVEGPETVRLVVIAVRHARPPKRAAVITIQDADS